ncbi:PAS domain-containing protein [Aurantivibrio plasticivorans]
MQLQSATADDQEVSLAEEEFIVSKTDTKGRIIYVNRTFMRISGFSESELLGKPHNVIRHSDMPRAVFRVMWNTLQQGEEFFGYVKNRCKNGGYYWVFANVTPVHSISNELIGYYSVRRQPTRSAINKVIPLYQSMCEIEQRYSGQQAIDASLKYFQGEMDKRHTDYLSLILSIENQEPTS